MTVANKKTIRIACGISLAVIVVLSVLWLVTRSFAIQAVIHIVMDLCWFVVGMLFAKKAFKSQVPSSMKKMLFWLGLVVFLDLIVVSNLRYILSSGVSGVLFLPACFPLGFMIVMHYTHKEMSGDTKREKRISCVIGIPLLLISLYFEGLAFMQILI